MIRSRVLEEPEEDRVAAGRVIANKYRLVGPIGKGMMGAVWRAEHIVLGAPVALKLIHRHFLHGPLANEIARRFAREARAVAAVRSPHVVQILDHGVDDGLPYIALELLEGEGLDVMLGKKKRLSIAETARYTTHVARALTRAREVGYIHRDLKPSNIFIVEADGSKKAKVLDFGLAKALGGEGLTAESLSTLTEVGRVLGTPFYMSPEHVRGREIDERADVWSLAVIAFHCITGTHPFQGTTVQDLLIEICGAPPKLFSEIDRALPQSLDTWLLRALDRAPTKRFQTARDLADALADIAEEGAPSTRRIDLPATPGDAEAPKSSAEVTVIERQEFMEPTEEFDVARLLGAERSEANGGYKVASLYESVLDLDELTKLWEGADDEPTMQSKGEGPSDGSTESTGTPASTMPSSKPVRFWDRVYLRTDGRVLGPILMLEVVQALLEGRVSLDTPIRLPHATDWSTTLRDIRVVGEGARKIDLLDLEARAPRPAAEDHRPAAGANPIAAVLAAQPAPSSPPAKLPAVSAAVSAAVPAAQPSDRSPPVASALAKVEAPSPRPALGIWLPVIIAVAVVVTLAVILSTRYL